MAAPRTGDFEIPRELPVLPLREFVVFPYMVLPLFVTREKSVAAIEDALAGERLILLVAQRNAELEDPSPDDLHRVGTVAMVMRILRMPDGRVKALVQGLAKARIESFVENEPAHWVQVSPIPADDETEWNVEAEALMRTVRGRVEELLPLKNLPPEVLSITANVHEPGRLADLVASNLKLRLSEAQEVLEIVDPLARLRRVDALLRRELEVSSMQAEIQSQAKEELSRGQREHYLREQLRAIQNELGEVDSRSEDVAEYRQRLEEAGLAPEAHEEAQRQLRRLERMHPDGPEAQVVRSYLDWMVELPWSKLSPDRLDLRRARHILDEDHAHLEGIKERILEFLGVRKLRQDSRGPILCFSGPPGVGKTSLGRSIARAMGREFVRVSLGGIRDEAEIRGHRRTYVGALPGRILQGLKQAGTRNPVFVLDELDKLGADFRGDPSSALLEVLDPEQNARFSDHYLNVPFDLSGVFFVATANLLDRVPSPLRDRMEVIRVPGYTPEEKLDIARSYLIPRQTVESGLPASRIRWSDAALRKMVTDYTFEAGVRELERKIAAVCRKAARRAAEGDDARGARRPEEPRALPRAGAPRADSRRRGGRGGRRLRARLDRGGRRRAARRGGDDARARARAHRPARRRDEGERAGGAHLGALAARRARCRRGSVLAPRAARARAGGRDPEGRPLGGHHHGDGARLARHRHSREGERRDDRRGDAARPRAARGRRAREGAGRAARGHPRDAASRAQPRRSHRGAEGARPQDEVRGGVAHGRGARARARAQPRHRQAHAPHRRRPLRRPRGPARPTPLGDALRSWKPEGGKPPRRLWANFLERPSPGALAPPRAR